ncbi:MAG: transcription elongation factor GreA [Chloroflexi bacterium]|nr:transcription elongation factor GreA [Chloroflexota bacterium]
MSGDSPTLSEAAAEFIVSLPAELRSSQQQELNRFIRWFGPDHNMREITGQTLETYQQQVESTGADLSRRLEPVKSFLIYAQRCGYIVENIAKLIKFKKVASRKAAKIEQRMEDAVQLTPEGYEALRSELNYLIDEVRPLVAHELREARIDKDFRENAPFDVAKQHQAHVEARIRELERVLGSATLLKQAPRAERVAIGSTVLLYDLNFNETTRYTLVSSSEADPKAGKISTVSPVGKALLDRTEGEVIEVAAPAGTISYRIDAIER